MMNSRNFTLALLGVALVALTVMLVALTRKVDEQTALIGRLEAQQRQSAAATRSAPPTPPAAARQNTTVPAPPAAAAQGAPWQAIPAPREPRDAALPGIPGSYASSAAADRKARTARLNELQKDLRSLMAKSAGRPAEMDIGELDALLGRLIEIQGNPVVGGIDLRVLRQNLVVARDMQALAKELEAETRRPNPDKARMDGLVQRIQSLQQGLRLDILRNPALPPSLPDGAERAPK
jgi:hypothetical protein